MKREEGIAILAAVKNRSAPLKYSLATWIDSPAKQIILVDWSSDNDLKTELETMDIVGYPDERIVHVKAIGEQYWESSTAWNLGIRFVTQTKTLKLDADVCISQKWMLNLGGGELRSLNWKGARSANEAFLTGSWFGHTADFIQVGGYDERLAISYGYEDDSLYNRMEAAGAKRLEFEPGTLLHLPHPTKTRFENYRKTDDNTDYSLHLYETAQPWTKEMAIEQAARFKFKKLGDNQWEARRQSPSNV